MVRQTSIESYHQIKDEGLLGRKQFEVYECLYNHGPLTANQVFRRLKGSTTITQANIHARVNELRKFGSVYETGKVMCEITGKKVLQFDVTKDLPVKPLPTLSNEEKIKRLKKAYLFLLRLAEEDVKEVARLILRGKA